MSGRSPSERTRVRRHPERGAYDRKTVYAIFDEGFVCHMGLVVDGSPRVIPMIYGRKGNLLYLHGSPASAALSAMRRGAEACVSVTLVDGLVLARSALYHSMNYRSVLAFGRARAVEGAARKENALRVISEHLVRGRWKDVRPPSLQELRATQVLAFPLSEVSAKVRSGPPKDLESDLRLPAWAGVVPLRLTAGEPVAEARVPRGVACPKYARSWGRGGRCRG